MATAGWISSNQPYPAGRFSAARPVDGGDFTPIAHQAAHSADLRDYRTTPDLARWLGTSNERTRLPAELRVSKLGVGFRDGHFSLAVSTADRRTREVPVDARGFNISAVGNGGFLVRRADSKPMQRPGAEANEVAEHPHVVVRPRVHGDGRITFGYVAGNAQGDLLDLDAYLRSQR